MEASTLAASLPLLLRLAIGHMLVVFFLQPLVWFERIKKQELTSSKLYLLALAYGLVSWLAVYDLRLWHVALVLGCFHFAITAARLWLNEKHPVRDFIVDQAIHGSILVGVWLLLTHTWPYLIPSLSTYWNRNDLLVLIIATIAVLAPAGALIRLFTKRWADQIVAPVVQGTTSSTPANALTELQEAGRYIGWLERLLVLTFVLLKQYEAIGLLIAAKSILRFQDSERKQSEYVVIGTLASFTVAILVGLLTRRLIDFF